MKAKVLTYSSCGRKTIQKYFNLSPVNSLTDIFITEQLDVERVGLVFKFKDVFVCEAEYPLQTIINNAEKLPELKAKYLENLPGANWVSVLHIELYNLLGMNTDILETRRNAILAERNEQEQAKTRKQEEYARQHKEARKNGLNASLEKLKAGERIERDHFLELCKLNGIELHGRTVGMLNKLSVCEIGIHNAFIPKGRINLDKVFEAAKQLVNAN